MPSFTETMLERYSDEITVATQHPFLAAAGRHELARDKLSEWLTQDRCYALHGYPKFIASLISALPLSSFPHQADAHKTLSLLSYALSNIDREVTFFDDLSSKYLVDLEVSPDEEERDNKLKRPIGSLQGQVLRPTTRAYIDLMIATGAEASRNGGNLEEAIVLLWTMEKLYNLAWQYAGSLSPVSSSSRNPSDPRTSAAITELIQNWTSDEFGLFVEKCGEEVEKLDLIEGTDAWERAEEMFKYVLYLEQRFWPDMYAGPSRGALGSLSRRSSMAMSRRNSENVSGRSSVNLSRRSSFILNNISDQ
ncbi:transcription regulator PAB1642 [Rhodotorula toruloides]|uniref:Transcription regulator PAB1642 n=1 Tax=Rhodotorula toruloides TaxID=5286 RepID=A0A511KA25_RHOTO|nr:transcription regulator PAB1642 [Rhodotorula toruloides]